MKRIAAALIALFAANALAQDVPPALMVRLPNADRSTPLKLSKLAVEARIVGHVAETRMTMTFANPNNRALAGDLYFPLPEGATVSGYALDIGGAMVDGVIVEKERGRQVFESIVRQGIDPGLVEWTKGNNFKTRVFPIPANGTRTIRVDFVSDLIDDPTLKVASYHLPLNFKDKIAEVSVRIDVVKPGDTPTVQHGFDDFRFEGWEHGFRAQTVLKDATLDKPLVVAVPGIDKKPVQIEKGDDGEFYFAITETAPAAISDVVRPPAAPKDIVLLWDASGSRASADKTKELDVLKRLLASYKGNVTVELIAFRDQPAKPVRFEIIDDDATALLGEIGRLDYDGGTRMSAIAPPASRKAPDFYLLFTDGLSNFGGEEPGELNAPAYVFSSDATANFAFLRYLALKHAGGAYYNLNKTAPAAAAAEIAAGAKFSYLTVDADKANFAMVYPRLAQPVAPGSRFTVVGKLLADEGIVRVTVGPTGGPGKAFEYSVRKADAVAGGSAGLVRRFWASQKVAELMIFPERNEEDIVATGKLYGLVTPFTSLIVLDNLQQYLQHGIRPPASLPEVRKGYDEQIAAREIERKKDEQSKLDRVLAMWTGRVEWWSREFKYAKDFRYKEPATTSQPELVMATDGRSGAADPASGEARPAARPSAEPAAPPAPPAVDQPLRDLAGNHASDERGGEATGKRRGDSAETSVEPGVVVKAWDPKTPYIAALKAAKPDELFAVYMKQRKAHATSPAFYFDCANYLFSIKRGDLAMQVLSNIAELELENAALLRVLGYKLAEVGSLDLAIDTFEKVLKIRGEEPQSYRDLALVLAQRAAARLVMAHHPAARVDFPRAERRAYDDYKRSLDLLAHVVMNKWDRFEEIEIIALMELNRVWAEFSSAKFQTITDKPAAPVDARLVKLLDCDIRIVMSWDADLTDMDLHVVEPSGEEAYYSHNRTTIGGAVSRDFTQGYGPEEYILRKAMPGSYKIRTKYYGSRAQSLQGPVTLTVEVISNFGRANEKRRTLTLRLSETKEMFDVGEMEF